MPNNTQNRLLRPETLTAIGLIVVSVTLLIPTVYLPRVSALLPATMLISLLVLAVIMLVTDQRKASNGEMVKPMTKAPRRVLSAFVLVVLYALSVDFFGFYPSTALSVPLVAYLFGYRSPVGLAVATAIFMAAIYLIFGFAMNQEFPAGYLWSHM